jgi:LPS export ABC transporter protein LptC
VRFSFNIPFFRFCLIALLASGSIIACKKNDLKQVEDLTTKTVPTENATNIELIYSDSAIVKAKLTAPLLVRYLAKENPALEMPKGLFVQFFDKGLIVKSWMRADYGIRYINTNITKVTGNVQVRNVKGDSLNTEEMFWDEKKEKVYGNKQVTVRTKTQVIIADGFESDISFTNYKFHNIKGTIELNEGK